VRFDYEVWLWYNDNDLMMMFVYEVDYELDCEDVFDKCYVLLMNIIDVGCWCLRLLLMLDVMWFMIRCYMIMIMCLWLLFDDMWWWFMINNWGYWWSIWLM
jgi:hypothetical protein